MGGVGDQGTPSGPYHCGVNEPTLNHMWVAFQNEFYVYVQIKIKPYVEKENPQEEILS
jgi:hypothetical protein